MEEIETDWNDDFEKVGFFSKYTNDDVAPLKKIIILVYIAVVVVVIVIINLCTSLHFREPPL